MSPSGCLGGVRFLSHNFLPLRFFTTQCFSDHFSSPSTCHHCNANDTQLYFSFQPDDLTVTVHIAACLTDISGSQVHQPKLLPGQPGTLELRLMISEASQTILLQWPAPADLTYTALRDLRLDPSYQSRLHNSLSKCCLRSACMCCLLNVNNADYFDYVLGYSQKWRKMVTLLFCQINDRI